VAPRRMNRRDRMVNKMPKERPLREGDLSQEARLEIERLQRRQMATISKKAVGLRSQPGEEEDTAKENNGKKQSRESQGHGQGKGGKDREAKGGRKAQEGTGTKLSDKPSLLHDIDEIYDMVKRRDQQEKRTGAVNPKAPARPQPVSKIAKEDLIDDGIFSPMNPPKK
jgi:hypothetical protein